ncbi:tyrosine recombinase XerC [Inhella proteolytica]|uniref:Tyrosine recombinase XerC n=1 Tax=Inhella proteolytica TaxID=2795029 RepID=A0A931IYT1_9BURK|nr:tyrosine recombinase XerC [Inhella proteolytica]MBH9576276.1 tyrosine recombinase XerC [Inhella proteolytica]
MSLLPEHSQPYLQHLRVERRLAERSLLLYEAALQRLQAGCEALGTAPLSLRPAAARELLARLHAGGLAPRSLALTLSAWRGYYRWLAAQRLLDHDPLVGLRAPKAGRPLPKALGVDDAVALASHQAGDEPLALRDHCLIELLYGAGLRISEVLGLDVAPGGAGYLDLQSAEALVLGKGGKVRSVPLGQAAMAAVQAWLAVRAQLAKADEPALLVGERGRRLSASHARLRLAQAAQQAGLPTHVHPHMLRHSYASHLLQSSGDLRAVQELLGHANIRTTQVYTRLDWQHLAKTYDAAHPRAKPKPKP